MQIRTATADDWPAIYAFYREIMADGQSYAFPEDQSMDEAEPWWMECPPGQSVVAVDGGRIIGSAKMGPNRPGRGAHLATASFLVDPGYRNLGAGRLLGEHVIAWAREQQYRGIQFNAVVETNYAAVHLWQSLGFRILGTVPGAYNHRVHGMVGLHFMFKELG
ncbi:GNAT family N-acetyltransferase [Glutamicibacter sp. FBE19]|uniref:GNAT family N-acetyltransferase n=1 Tax=Glutamicibacter sp. FBE19 TaxID=2761534 RepID=UPI00189670CB|nr:GNAT family N-acetyltransferase [Glutamicibacter sp. FBE19]MBF6670725.1 GNAT family N-acetyltransferase [Glutamicibacter sp. FBE19]